MVLEVAGSIQIGGLVVTQRHYRTNLSKEELIILHLLNNYKNKDEYFASELLTEEGIHSKVNCSLCYISRILKKLKEEGYVSRRLMRIENIKRKHNAFILTDKGYKLAEKIRKKAQND